MRKSSELDAVPKCLVARRTCHRPFTSSRVGYCGPTGNRTQATDVRTYVRSTYATTHTNWRPVTSASINRGLLAGLRGCHAVATSSPIDN